MKRDDDVIRGVGYVTIQASHLEGSIEHIAVRLASGIKRPEHHESARISDKIKWCKSAIRELRSPMLHDLDKSLDQAANLLEKRNRLVHGRIYFDRELSERIVPNKKNQRERNITPGELYDLAEDIYHLHTRILAENSFKLVATLSEIINA